MTRRLNTDIHVGVAIDTDDGLIVPVLRNAQDLDLAGIDEELTRLTRRRGRGASRPTCSGALP